MTDDQLLSMLSSDISSLSAPHAARLKTISDSPAVLLKLRGFLGHVIMTELARGPVTPEKVRSAMASLAVATFRLGLVVGLELDREPPPPPTLLPTPCDLCDGSGYVCLQCGNARRACECKWSDIRVASYDPVLCPVCHGEGVLPSSLNDPNSFIPPSVQ